MNPSTIMAILIDKRTDAAPKVQEILTEHGCLIETRLGTHQANSCSEEGLIILSLCGSKREIDELEKKLTEVYRVQVKKMQLQFEN